jgi:carbon storage regulator
MLVLTRRQGETILIGDNIKLTVVTTGNAVKIGIDAPKEVRVMRTELVEGAAKVPSMVHT